ncbi:MAG: hypothetical protein ACKOC5_12060 [Chloroflexota bacterium]
MTTNYVIDVRIPENKYLETMNLVQAMADYHGSPVVIDEMLRLHTQSDQLANALISVLDLDDTAIFGNLVDETSAAPEPAGSSTPELPEPTSAPAASFAEAPDTPEPEDERSPEAVQEAQPVAECIVCGAAFLPGNRRAKYCSSICYGRAWRARKKAAAREQPAEEQPEQLQLQAGEPVLQAEAVPEPEAAPLIPLSDEPVQGFKWMLPHGQVAVNLRGALRSGNLKPGDVVRHITKGEFRVVPSQAGLTVRPVSQVAA